MIQRIQSLWLLLSAAALMVMYKMPVYSVVLQNDSIRNLMAGESMILAILGGAITLLPLVAIFFFKNRLLQKKLIVFQLLGIIVFLIILWSVSESFVESGESNNLQVKSQQFKIGVIMPVVSFVFSILAYRGIRHDEKLIKSVDRLR